MFLDILKNFVGDHNARHGVIKLFEVLQEEKLNRHLLYVHPYNFEK